MTRKLLIFDLDETLVHASPMALPHAADLLYPPYFVYQRPFIEELLDATRALYDFAVWSSASRNYVDAVVGQVFGVQNELKFAWAVERCVQRVDVVANSYVYIKDLRKVQGQGYAVEHITMLDDSPEKIARQPRNHLRISPYLGQSDDRALLGIIDDLICRAAA
ncbi:HAD family hydrolase [Janthinobacterium sp. 1_2014MBL_MicDiv]|uniref:HAD family hydrolase n=1 Tax=Janthinobacterium sp. 1_2014MBL_MicDiv TaxID=1644131 RepID=UPI0009F59FF3|nr:HAD family hydrolase [Janthinobacterium sp. 1_2014MBL_MicDiv]